MEQNREREEISEIWAESGKESQNQVQTQASRNLKVSRKGGAPKGNRNAAKIGQDLKYQSYMSKTTRSLFEEFFQLRFGRTARNEAELVQVARQIGEVAIKHEMALEFERHQPGRVSGSSGEVF